MRLEERWDAFVASSGYSRVVDVKKLWFIFDAVQHYCETNGLQPSDVTILEAGCGTGGITLPLASLGATVTAFDIDPPAVATLRARAADCGLSNVSAVEGNGNDFNDGELYDIVVMSEVLEHVLEPRRLFGNLARRLRPHGYLVITVPNGFGPWELSNRVNPRSALARSTFVRRLRGKPPYVRGTGRDHCQYFTRDALLALFGDASLRLLRSGNSDGFLAISRRLSAHPRLARTDCRLADILPDRLASGWYFVLQAPGAAALGSTNDPSGAVQFARYQS